MHILYKMTYTPKMTVYPIQKRVFFLRNRYNKASILHTLYIFRIKYTHLSFFIVLKKFFFADFFCTEMIPTYY